MAYSAQADIAPAVCPTAVLSSLTDGTAGTIGTAVLADAIAEADLTIDSYIGAIYGPTPLASPPAIIKRLSINLTLYNLALRPGRAQGGIDLVIEIRGKGALEYLKRVAEGKATLPGLTPTSDVVRMAPTGAVPIFSMKRTDKDGNSVGTPETGTLDNY